ncbi:hypothetical protein [Blastococcus mobilis]|uniref:DUF4352 domain-containing protein n=1 Tax=Blastococcus mobilis TaxID=1938746 RepID=A0A238W6P1_9ACTN|nr:hypothetical protein [Blastococcus mobilis]SNR41369.1 hypothetical protein SAMN06272737_10698 [Blastococcus mobilis]
MSVTSPPPDGAAHARRRRLQLSAAVVALLALCAAVLMWNRGQDGDSGTARAAGTATVEATVSPTATPSWTPPPAPVTPEATGDVDQPPPDLPAVALRKTASVGDGITGSVTRMSAIEGTAVGPGNVSGPALRITVRIHNGTAEPVSLDGVTVALAYGDELTPASPLDDPSQAPFSGTVAAGESADGVYVFSIPSDARHSITLSVGYQAGAPVMVFTGPAG